jgi:Ran GTPase-activating protein (RanGAP) involved in mRNA processing and transport
MQDSAWTAEAWLSDTSAMTLLAARLLQYAPPRQLEADRMKSLTAEQIRKAVEDFVPDLCEELAGSVEKLNGLSLKSNDVAKRSKAALGLVKPGDTKSLEIALDVLLKDPVLVEQPGFETMLEKVCTEYIPKLDLKDKQLKCILPACIVKLLCTADSYDLSGNQFNGVAVGSIAAGLLYKTKNLSAITEINWCEKTHTALSAELSLSRVLSHMIPNMPRLERILVQHNSVGLPLTVLSSLDLSSSGLQTEGAVVISWLLSHSWQGLSNLNMADNNLGEEGIKPFIDALKSNEGLTIINVLNNNVHVGQIEDLIMLQSKKTLKSICGIKPDQQEAKFLGSSGQDLGNVCDCVLLAADIKNLNVLLSLDIKASSIGDKGKTILGRAITESNVKYMVCDMWSITKETTELDVSNQNLQYADAVLLGGVFHNNQSLSNLHVGSNNIPEEQMKEMIATALSKETMKTMCEVPLKNKTLTELDLTGKGLGTEGALVIAGYLSNNVCLRKINLSNNRMATAIAGRALGRVLKLNSTLEDLDISQNLWDLRRRGGDQSGGNGAEFGKAISEGLASNEKLVIINLENNKIPAELEERMYQKVRMSKLRIVLANASMSDMTELDVTGIGFGVEGVFAIAEYLKANSTLLTLNLSNNKLIAHSDQGRAVGKALGNMVTENKSLTKLNVSNNTEYSSTKSKGFAEEFLCGLENNASLSMVDISDNKIPCHLVQQIREKASCNQLVPLLEDISLRELDLFGIDFGCEGALAAARHIKENVALSKLTFGLKQRVTIKVSMTDANFSDKGLGASGSIILAAFLLKCQ